jgi:hypothetical protein
MLKYTPFFKVLEYIILDAWTDIELDFEEKLSVGHEIGFGLVLTYHRIYKGKDTGEIVSFNLAHCDDEEMASRASEGKSRAFNETMDKIDSSESREKFILFSIFKERMNFVYTKIKSELRNKKAKEELENIKLIINEESKSFLEVVNANYPNHFPKDWTQFEQCEKVQLAELAEEDQEETEHDPEYVIKMRFR